MAPHILISGTGRTGTTLLVQILTDLGLDTGFERDTPIDQNARAGLERSIVSPDAPRVVKDTIATPILREFLESGKLELEHVIVPVRDPEVAAASRVRTADYGHSLGRPGGLFHTTRASHQRQALTELFYELIAVLVEHEVPLTLLWFPRWALDPEYTFRRLGFLTPGVDAAAWRQAMETRVHPSMIHETPLSFRERIRAQLSFPATRRQARRLRRDEQRLLAKWLGRGAAGE